MLTHENLDLLWNIEVLCQRCIRAERFFNVVSGSKSNAWAFTQNCYGEICVILWCQVFGALSEPTHYSKLFEAGPLAGMRKQDIEVRLRQSTGKDVHEYKKLWQEVKIARDKFMVHNEFNSKDIPCFPDLDSMVKVCLEMRNIIREIVTSEKSDDPKKQGDIVHFVSCFTNAIFLATIQDESFELIQSLKS